MNPQQLTTLEEAREIARDLGSMGGGVIDVYIPEYLGPYRPPEIGESRFYHFKFANGADGFNAGLVREMRKYFPTSWPSIVTLEVNRAAASRREL